MSRHRYVSTICVLLCAGCARLTHQTAPLRPYFASAILRLARPLNQLEYESFIALQDKLHMNLCRQRRFVAIGTHDLDTIEGPFRYLCRDPNEIKFAPLNREVESTAAELMVSYEVSPASSVHRFCMQADRL